MYLGCTQTKLASAGGRLYTYVMTNVYITKSDGTKELFQEAKLANSLMNAGASREDSTEIVEHIEKELVDGMSTSKIYEHAFFLLKKKRSRAAAVYSLKRAVLELGPSGFPFENFVAEIFKDKGYKTRTGVMLRGGCIEHEVDVIAVNENEFIIVEAKFHNDLGIKTDAKVPLYVNSRLEDLRKSNFDNQKPKDLKEDPWIITNTKLSTSAKEYGKCVGINMVDWNYPQSGSLRELIEDSSLHPLTCLTTLSKKEKDILLDGGLVISKHLSSNSEPLKNLGIPDDRIGEVMEEIKSLKR